MRHKRATRHAKPPQSEQGADAKPQQNRISSAAQSLICGLDKEVTMPRANGKRHDITLHLSPKVYGRLADLAKIQNTIPYTVCMQLVENYTLDNRHKLTMGPEHYTARDNEWVDPL